MRSSVTIVKPVSEKWDFEGTEKDLMGAEGFYRGDIRGFGDAVFFIEDGIIAVLTDSDNCSGIFKADPLDRDIVRANRVHLNIEVRRA